MVDGPPDLGGRPVPDRPPVAVRVDFPAVEAALVAEGAVADGENVTQGITADLVRSLQLPKTKFAF